MRITVEFFGIPRQRAGVAQCELDMPGEATTLGAVLIRLKDSFPELAADCLRHDHLAPGYTANLCGERFVTDPATVLRDGDALLILSADAGG